MKGYLYKKERFTWNKMHCLIRNSFLECHKPSGTQGPSLKLFLPRSIVTPDTEVKRQWAFKVKHPRREGVLQFAAESEEDYRTWMKAFNSAAAIEVHFHMICSIYIFLGHGFNFIHFGIGIQQKCRNTMVKTGEHMMIIIITYAFTILHVHVHQTCLAVDCSLTTQHSGYQA